MEKHGLIELHESRGLISKIDFLEGLTETEFSEGMIKFDIFEDERVWGWISPADRVLYENNKFRGEIKAILCNTPLSFYGILFWGTEVVIKCDGDSRPTISYEWVNKNIIDKEWYFEEISEDD